MTGNKESTKHGLKTKGDPQTLQDISVSPKPSESCLQIIMQLNNHYTNLTFIRP